MLIMFENAKQEGELLCTDAAVIIRKHSEALSDDFHLKRFCPALLLQRNPGVGYKIISKAQM